MMIIKQFILFIFLLFAVNVDACTTFCLSQEGGFVFGRNYDWHLGHGLVIVNKKGIQKRSFTFYPEEPVDWVSKYGSVTFNQFGREFPLGGMNEKGLVVEVMWLEETVYQGKDDRPVMNELQWVQYQLDNFKSVKEVLKELENIRIGQTYTPIHYLVADSKGIVASIEHIKGETVIHTGDDLPVPVLTNDTYDR
ncbi:MAG: linear amide C-N hydrolase [Bacteroidetes bacterium]|nr:linear amide C-N hydrolase [Bacteroidota bacterium]